MASVNDFTTAGKVITVQDGGGVIFNPRGTNYEMHLKMATAYAGPVNAPVHAIIRVTARKVYTVPRGGNFVSPIIGPPRIVQGRVLYADERQLVIRAGANVIVDLPAADTAIDLDQGGIAINSRVNVVALPGARFEWSAATPVVAAQT